ncbi:flagellar biosynthetic protein FliR [Methylocella silvestris]|uniref:flagellar biosynthetic protein FliR n=1 Tax=Methylocella silvestris TaxID=199596 RepID=UPI002477ED46|nr:flagellar biosynthetic protein FliR [Methylocella silvestris]
MPGISSARIPARVRLFVGFAITLGLTPLLSDEVGPAISAPSPFLLIRTIISESLIGGLIGFLGRIFFGALDALANAIAMAIGLSSPLAPPADDNEPAPAIVSLISLGALMLFFLTNLHWEVLRGLLASYSVWPVSGFSTHAWGLPKSAIRLHVLSFWRCASAVRLSCTP